jgi:hypothetical protein
MTPSRSSTMPRAFCAVLAAVPNVLSSSATAGEVVMRSFHA